jgi:hypothetical protein
MVVHGAAAVSHERGTPVRRFAPSSAYMPPFMRVNPVVDWTYGMVNPEDSFSYMLLDNEMKYWDPETRTLNPKPRIRSSTGPKAWSPRGPNSEFTADDSGFRFQFWVLGSLRDPKPEIRTPNPVVDWTYGMVTPRPET